MSGQENTDIRPRRSALYMPGANPRALEKGRTVPADCLIMDVEDGVLPENKSEARENIIAALAQGGYGGREKIIRINGMGTEWFEADIAAAARSGADGILIPKVDGPDTVRRVDQLLGAAGAPAAFGIWCMLETPLGVLNARDTAQASDRLRVFTLGTADLSKELHADLHAPDRLPLITSIGLCVLAARAYGLALLDAPHFDLSDDAGFERACRQGKSFGFDGKTLLHPKTIAVANGVFGPSADEITWARRITEAWNVAAAEGKGVTLVDGKLIEGLHVAEAGQLIALADRITALESGADLA
jgi:citrate lyase subunit beta / citryl-CoA lyase